MDKISLESEDFLSDTLRIVSDVLEKLVSLKDLPENWNERQQILNDQTVKDCEIVRKNPDNTELRRYSVFKAQKIPDIKFTVYISRIKKYTNFEDEIFVLGQLLLFKSFSINFNLRHPNFIHKLWCCCLTLASKLTDDGNYSMKDLSRVFGISQDTLIIGEKMLFLEIFKLRIGINGEEYWSFWNQINETFV